VNGDTAAQLWCREQLLRMHPQWRLQEQLLPPALSHDLQLLHGVFYAMLQIPLAASASEVAEPKLAWWVDALQQLLHSSSQSSAIVTQDTVEPASLQHPALRRLQGSPLLSFLRAVPLTDWLQDLQQAIEPQPLSDSAELIHCYWQLARPLGWLDIFLIDATNWQQVTAAADASETDQRATHWVHTRRLLLQQINLLPQRNWLYHNMPLSLRARHQLQLDTALQAPAAALASEKRQQPWCCPGALLADLLALDAELKADISANMSTMSPPLQAQCRFWQAGNRALAKSLRKRVNSGHAQPVSGIGPGLLCSSWRSARTVRARAIA
jgi:hypothetical protein